MSTSLMAIVSQIMQVTLPITISIGIIGNILNICVLIRPRLYNHACSRYFIALACNNLFYSSVILILRLLANTYEIYVANQSMVICKIVIYLAVLNSFYAPYFIICASIDRFCASSTNARIRRFSSVRTAKVCIAIILGFFALFFIQSLVIANLQPDLGNICMLDSTSVYSQIYAIVQVFGFAVIPPVVMILFGILTIVNSNRLRTIRIAASNNRRTEYQLARMLIIQVVAHIGLTIGTSITYLFGAIPNPLRNTILFVFLQSIFQVTFDFSYVTPFFIYVLTGRIYRNEVIGLIRKVFRMWNGNQVEPTRNQNTTFAGSTLVHRSPRTINNRQKETVIAKTE